MAVQTATGAELEQVFDQLARGWKEERGPTSSATEMALCPSYQRIIGLGPAVVPLLLRELDRDPDHWFWALKAITGADPVPAASRGKVREMARLWSVELAREGGVGRWPFNR
jgi:hypothetical protein